MPLLEIPLASLSFGAPWFLWAGLVCAAAPLIIHLLNRRQYREINWAAMDFLREAVQRSRRMLELRDILLLILRTAAIVLFGVALAQPFLSGDTLGNWPWILLIGIGAGLSAIVAAALWSDNWLRLLCSLAALVLGLLAGWLGYLESQRSPSESQAANVTEPVHAIMLVDNSLSMSLQALDGSQLDHAKRRAKEFVEKLPSGSQVSVIPWCGQREGVNLKPVPAGTAANDLIDQLEVVDRTADFAAASNSVKKAREAYPDMNKQVVFIGDQQLRNWPKMDAETLKDTQRIFVVPVAPVEADNSYIASFRMQDEIADTETESKLLVEVRHQGTLPRRDVQVTLTVLGRTPEEDQEIGTQTLTLQGAGAEAGGARELEFRHTFDDISPEPGQAVYVPLRVSVTHDNLPIDDERFLVVPVVSALPVLFIDEYSDDQERNDKNLHGETFRLRRLLAPKLSSQDATRHLVRVEHLRVDQVDQQALENARLVVIAGVDDPAAAVPVLREYVRQGGQLLIAAGGKFNPSRWTESAWKDGEGILPCPLEGEAIGKVPDEAPDQLEPFAIRFQSVQNDALFLLSGESEEYLRDLYSLPIFFKAVVPQLDSATTKKIYQDDLARLTKEYDQLDDLRARRAEKEEKSAKEGKGGAPTKSLEDTLIERIRPSWLVWKSPLSEALPQSLKRDPAQRSAELERLALASQPKTLAAFEREGLPAFIVERQIGAGRVLLVTSGLASGASSSWNTLLGTNASILFDRLVRARIESTLPVRNFDEIEQVNLPLASNEPGIQYTVVRPATYSSAKGASRASGETEPLDVGFLGADVRGVTLQGTLDRGIYRVLGRRGAASADPDAAAAGDVVAEIAIAINGPADESELAVINRQQLEDRTGKSDRLVWVPPGNPIPLAADSAVADFVWEYALAAMLLGLLAEMIVLALMPRASATTETSQPAA